MSLRARFILAVIPVVVALVGPLWWFAGQPAQQGNQPSLESVPATGESETDAVAGASVPLDPRSASEEAEWDTVGGLVVVEEPQPRSLAGAWLSVRDLADRRSEPVRVPLPSSGEFQVKVRRGREYEMWCSAVSNTRPKHSPMRFAVPAEGETRPIRFVLLPIPRSVRSLGVHVRNRDGQPVRGAVAKIGDRVVHCDRTGNGWLRDVEIGLLWHCGGVVVEATGLGPWRTRGVRLNRGDANLQLDRIPPLLTLTLPTKKANLRVRVLDTSDGPVGNVTVQFLRGFEVLGEATTDPSGVATIGPTWAVRGKLRVAARGLATATRSGTLSAGLAVSEAEVERSVDQPLVLHVTRARDVTIRVSASANGVPVARAWIELSHESGSHETGLDVGYADEQGRFVARIPRTGRSFVQVVGATLGYQDSPKMRVTSESLIEVRLQTTKSAESRAGEVRGTVRGMERGGGAPDAALSRVWLRALSSGKSSVVEETIVRATGPDGAFHFGGLAPGRYALAATLATPPATSKPQIIDVAEGQSVTASPALLPRLARASGRVTDQRAGPLPGVSVFEVIRTPENSPGGQRVVARLMLGESDLRGRFDVSLSTSDSAIEFRRSDLHSLIVGARDLRGGDIELVADPAGRPPGVLQLRGVDAATGESLLGVKVELRDGPDGEIIDEFVIESATGVRIENGSERLHIRAILAGYRVHAQTVRLPQWDLAVPLQRAD